MMAISTLTSTQKYAAGALLALALRQAQIHQTNPLGVGSSLDEPEERYSSASASSISSSGSCSDGDGPHPLWTHESHGLLRPVFRFLEIDDKACPGLEETAASPVVKHHIGPFLRLIFEEHNEGSSQRSEQEHALAKAVDVMARSLGDDTSIAAVEENHVTEKVVRREEAPNQFSNLYDEKTVMGDIVAEYQLKVAVLYELLSACVADAPQEDSKVSRCRKGYDARHRVALRLLATWLDVKWIQMEAMEIMVACSAMAAAKENAQSQENESAKSKWSKWKRGGIIGAAALTGGTLLAITGGLAAPAIAAGFSALAPTLGTLVPVIGAGGFAAIASAAGSVAGSVAVAASFGAAGAGLSGSKMARRIGGIEEFEFIPIGGHHNQGRLAVGIVVSGFVFENQDFLRPWEGWQDNSERYGIQWESKYLIAVSSAIQDWITSRLTMELMKQGAMMTVLSTLVTALAWPAALLAATDWIDSKWSMAIDRSDKAGKLLADVLIKGLQGNRPVTLVGFSLGARVIFKCLQQLAESGDNEGLIERVVLLGAPISLKGEQWESARKMVAGRFINVYSTNDWILGVTFRASLLTQGLAGIQPVDISGIENVDVSHLIDGHSSYLSVTQHILEQLELDTYYPVSNIIPPVSD
ncbi:putative transmembrane and coiled-coil domain-containing protein 4 [Iris pallida]|uniref:Transmembrane and coiled-coil domain-containing protein 4 n=1 Tax=Iris pallida TaxID=29817 RepID=A0AAX6DMG5_IRIPA|nr:putative transmembrane and coiled-coil domain-containing protein 4 [Iris pallida]KAJ6849639.1 putative transmembrane and coiled-coil domain-containing protein 4 [Iris pallida]